MLSTALNEWIDTKLDARFEAESKLHDKSEVVELLKGSKTALEERVQQLEARMIEQNAQLLELSGVNTVNKFVIANNTELKKRVAELETARPLLIQPSVGAGS